MALLTPCPLSRVSLAAFTMTSTLFLVSNISLAKGHIIIYNLIHLNLHFFFFFCGNYSIVSEQVASHGLIWFRLTGSTVLRNTLCTFIPLTTLTVIFSLTSHFSGVPLNTLIFFGRPRGDLQSFCEGSGFNFMSPSISYANLRK